MKNLVDLVGSLEATFQHPAKLSCFLLCREWHVHRMLECTANTALWGNWMRKKHITSTPWLAVFLPFQPILPPLWQNENCYQINCGRRGSCSCSLSFFTWSKGCFFFLFLENKVFPLGQIEQHQSLSTLKLQGTLFPCTDDCTFKYHIALCKRHVFIRNGTSQLKG